MELRLGLGLGLGLRFGMHGLYIGDPWFAGNPWIVPGNRWIVQICALRTTYVYVYETRESISPSMDSPYN